MTDPLSHTTTYAYDNASRQTAATDRNGRQRTFGYDNANRKTSETWLNGLGQGIYTATYAFDAGNRLTSESDNYSTYTFSYDSDSNVTRVDNFGTPSAPRVIMTLSYDAFRNRTSLTDNLMGSGGGVTYSYDQDFRLGGVTYKTSFFVTIATVGIGYDSAGRQTQVTDNSAITSVTAYDNANRVTGITQTTGVTTLETFTYTYDAADRVTGYTGPEGTLTYTYDNTSQLTGASGARIETYTYDANGNRTMTGYSTGTGNRLSSDGTYNYTYDNEGNLTTKTTIADNAQTLYSWDYRNRLTQVVVKNGAGATLTTDLFTYDVADRRIGKSVNGTQTWMSYDWVNPYADFNSGGSLTMRYVGGLAIDQMFARYNGTTTAFYLQDQVNSVRELVSAAGTVLDQITYDSFGNITNETNSGNGDRFKFTEREWDSELGQYFYRARYFGPSVGRFESEDPINFSAGDSNLYRYVANDPIDMTDPSGTRHRSNSGIFTPMHLEERQDHGESNGNRE